MYSYSLWIAFALEPEWPGSGLCMFYHHTTHVCEFAAAPWCFKWPSHVHVVAKLCCVWTNNWGVQFRSIRLGAWWCFSSRNISSGCLHLLALLSFSALTEQCFTSYQSFGAQNDQQPTLLTTATSFLSALPTSLPLPSCFLVALFSTLTRRLFLTLTSVNSTSAAWSDIGRDN